MISTARLDTSFDKDSNTYGVLGEEWFKNILISSPKTLRVVDTTSKFNMREYDIDFIQIKKEGFSEVRMFENLRHGHFLPEDYVCAYEVKVDTQITRTGNIAYEVMSHTRPGCFSRTMANYIVYIGIDENTNEVKCAYLIDTFKLRSWVLSNFTKIGQYKSGIKPYYMNHGEDKSGLLLIEIVKLLDNKIARRII